MGEGLCRHIQMAEDGVRHEYERILPFSHIHNKSIVMPDPMPVLDEELRRAALEEELGVGRTEPEIGDDVGPTDPYRAAI